MKKKITLLFVFALFSLAAIAQQPEKIKFLKFDESSSKKMNDAKQVLRRTLKLSSDDNLVKIKSETDKLGITHEKYQQFYKGIEVEFATYQVHAKNGKIKSINGEFFSPGKLELSPKLSKESAFQRALSYVGAKKYLWENPQEATLMGNYQKPQGDLMILPAEVFKGRKARLVYKFDIYAIQPISRANIYVDAHSGQVVFENKIIKHAGDNSHYGKYKRPLNTGFDFAPLATGNAQTKYSGTRSIETTLSGSNYILRETTRGNGIETYDMNLGTNYNSAVDFTDNDNNWTTAEHSANFDDAALDAHWGAEMTYDYFQQTFGRNSFDDNGAKIKSYVHFNLIQYGYPNNDNAFWNGSVMTYGDGTSFDPLTSLDIAAHEIGHAVCENTANLVYSYESGAMNEAFSDIWAASVEYFADPSKQTWLLAEEIGGPIRSLSNPNDYGQPDTYLGTNWYTGTADNGGVHYNSGVLNHWFYILTVGKSGTNDNGDSFSVTGIGIDKSAAIAYRMESVYMTSNSQYADARTAGIQAAEDLYGTGSTEVIATTNAFYAVGIGAEYVQNCALGAPSNLISSSINDNGFTISWNSVAGAASYTVTIGGTSTTASGTSYTATGLVPGTSYVCSVAPNCSAGGTGTAATVNVTTSGTPPLVYCSSNGNSVVDEYIGRVQIGSIDNSTGGTSGGYADYTSISTNLTKGNSVTVTITPTWTGTVYNEGYSVWIDYNKDGDFADSGEQVWTAAASKNTPVSGTFTVPTSATNGATTMRISMKYNGIPTACETFSYGEVEDYTVNILAGVADTTAPVITLNGASIINLQVGDTYTEQGATATDDVDGDISANIAITGTVDTNTAGTYSRFYNVSDAAGNAATQVTRTIVVTQPADTTAPVITLIGASTINLQVGDTYTEQGATATDNVDGDISANIVITGTVDTNTAGTYSRFYNVSDAAGNAATQVTRTINITQPSTGGCSGGITSFPYSESFENTLGAWTQSTSDDFNWTVDANGTPSSNTGPSSASSGAYYVYMESSSPNYSNKRAILNSPCFDLGSETEATFTFDYHMYGASTMGSLALELSDDNGATWASVWSASGNQGNSWLSASVDLSAYIGGSVQLRFNGITGTTWQGDMAVDNVSLSTSGGGGGGTGCSNVTLSITFDNYPEETAWSITNASGQTVASGGTYGSQADGSTLNINIGCLDDGCYDFTITDTYGDGICCTYGNGSYTLTNNDTGATLASGGSFTSSETTNFCLSAAAVNYGFTTSEARITEDLDKPFNIYPNPAKSILHVQVAGEGTFTYNIVNLMGQIVREGKLTQKSINVSDLQSGMYIIRVNDGDEVMTKRFVKE